MADVERLKAERDAALQVATTSFRDALMQQVYENGKPIGSLADLAHIRKLTADGQELVNFQVQALIADALRRWLVPPDQRPTCPLGEKKPCPNWTCLVDVCVDATKEAE